MMQYKNRTAVVSGAASGIGLQLALQLAERGCNLALIDRNLDGLKSVKNEVEKLGVKCLIEDVDVSSNDEIVRFSEVVISYFGRVDFLFNNAGVSLIDSVENQSLEDFHWLMNINFWGVVHGTNAFLPYLKKAEVAHIVNVSSLFGLLSLPLQSAYNASKFAVRGFTEALKMEMAGTGVFVHCVHPGGIKTKITQSAKISSLHVERDQILANFNKQAKTTAQDAASIILKGIDKNKRRILVGNDAKILDKIVRWFPASYERILGFEKGVLKKRSN